MSDTTERDLMLPNVGAANATSTTCPNSIGAATRGSRAQVSDRPTATTGSQVRPGGEATSGTQITYASKLPPDHPGLQLERPSVRTLRKGPLLASITIVGALVGIALIVAMSPRTEGAKAATPNLGEAPPKEITLPDAVRDAPGNNAEGQKASHLGPPLTGHDTQLAAPSAPPTSSGETERLREEHAKALASPILVEVENPTLGDQASVQTALAPAGAGGGGAPTNDPLMLSPSSAGNAVGSGDSNLQQRKRDFLAGEGEDTQTYVSQQPSVPRSPFEIKAGTIIPTTLITGINSDLPGQIVGQVRENVYDTVMGDHLLIPQGSRLLATYDSSVTFGQSRVLVCWNRVIRPDGVSMPLECMPGVDLAGYAGFADQVDNHWFRVITGVALGTLLSATAQRSQGDVTGFSPTIPQLWASNAGNAINQAGQQITQRNLAVQPTIKVRPGFTVNVLVTKDLVLAPYNR